MSAAHSPTPAQDLKPGLVSPPASTPPAQAPPKRWLPWLLAFVVAGGAGLWLMNRGEQTAAPAAPAAVQRTAVVTSGTLERVVRVSGQTAALDFANMTAPMMRGPDANREMVLMEIAKPGSWVKKGTLVARIDAQSLMDHIEDLGDTIASAEADIKKRKAEQSIELENLLQSLRLAKSEADKARLEYAGSETQTDIQRQLLKLTLDEADARYQQLNGDVAQKKAAHAAEVRILELTLLRHTRHRDRHKRDYSAFSVYAPMDGLVVMQQIFRGSEMGQVQQGDRVFPGQPFMKIVNTNKMLVEGSVNQAESSEFRIGQPVKIRLDAFPEKVFEGRVHSLGALANGGFRNSYYVRNVPIRIDIQGNDPRLIPDLSAGADVTVDSAADQVLVPRSALRSEGGKLVVEVKTAQAVEKREVQTGLTNDLYAAVKQGLKPGETVILR